MIPARSRYQGNVNFLDGMWQVWDEHNNLVDNIKFTFKKGKSVTQFTRGSNLCQANSVAAFTAKGQLLITSSSAYCQSQQASTLPTIVCENSTPNTHCYWRNTDSSKKTITLLQDQ